MRIVYGIHGYGRGHATRALGVLPELRQRHEVLVLAGGDAYQALAPLGPVTEIPTLTYVYRKSGKVAIEFVILPDGKVGGFGREARPQIGHAGRTAQAPVRGNRWIMDSPCRSASRPANRRLL